MESTTFSVDESFESNSSSEISYNEESEESDESCQEGLVFGYVGEPEYRDDELQSMKLPSVGSSSDESENELNSSRTENLHWCKCQHCIIMPSFLESVCCKELPLLNDKLQDSVKCIFLYMTILAYLC